MTMVLRVAATLPRRRADAFADASDDLSAEASLSTRIDSNRTMGCVAACGPSTRRARTAPFPAAPGNRIASGTQMALADD